MKLSEKGSFVPRPRLDELAEPVARAVETWPEVHGRTHWERGNESIVDGADFYVGERELGHIHLYNEAHIAVPRAVRDALIESGLAARFRWSPSFVVKRICDAESAREAEWIFGLAYDGLRGIPIEELIDRIRTRKAA